MRVLVGDRYGKVIGELTVMVGPVSWILNRTGKASLTVNKSLVRDHPDLFQIGNRVLIQFDNGLPEWGGTMELPRTWTTTDVTITCYTIEYLLGFRQTGKNWTFDGVPVGVIFQTLINRTQVYQSLGIGLGQIWGGGAIHSPRYHLKKLLTIFTDSICKMEGCDFAFIPQLSNGVISFMAELYLQRGADNSAGVTLIEDKNIGTDTTMQEQGPIVNHFASAGSGSTWGDERSVIVAEDAGSVRDLGLRESGDIFTGVNQGVTLDRHARTMTRDYAWPSVKLTLSALNKPPAEFERYDIGDIVRLQLPSYGVSGYDHSIRILGREFTPSSGQCSLVVEEPRANEPQIVGGGEDL